MDNQQQPQEENIDRSSTQKQQTQSVKLPDWIQKGKEIEVWPVSHYNDSESQNNQDKKPVKVLVTMIDDRYIHYANDEINGMLPITDYANEARKPEPNILMNDKLHVISAGNYYDDKKFDIMNGLGEVYTHSTRQQIAKNLKTVDLFASYAANEIAENITKAQKTQGFPEFPVLVPVPDHTGKATYNKEICDQISRMTGIFVADFLVGNKHKPLYDLKKQSLDVEDIDLGIHSVHKIPEKSTPILIDNVLGTGKTLSAAWEAIKGNDEQPVLAFVYADDPQALKSKDIVVSHTTATGIIQDGGIAATNDIAEKVKTDIPQQDSMRNNSIRFSKENDSFVGLPDNVRLGKPDRDNDGNIVQMVDDDIHRLELACPPENLDKVEIRVFLEPHRDAGMDPDHIADVLADKGYINDEDVKTEIASDQSFNYVTVDNIEEANRILSLAEALDKGQDIPAKVAKGETENVKQQEAQEEEEAENTENKSEEEKTDKAMALGFDEEKGKFTNVPEDLDYVSPEIRNDDKVTVALTKYTTVRLYHNAEHGFTGYKVDLAPKVLPDDDKSEIKDQTDKLFEALNDKGYVWIASRNPLNENGGLETEYILTKDFEAAKTLDSLINKFRNGETIPEAKGDQLDTYIPLFDSNNPMIGKKFYGSISDGKKEGTFTITNAFSMDYEQEHMQYSYAFRPSIGKGKDNTITFSKTNYLDGKSTALADDALFVSKVTGIPLQDYVPSNGFYQEYEHGGGASMIKVDLPYNIVSAEKEDMDANIKKLLAAGADVIVKDSYGKKEAEYHAKMASYGMIRVSDLNKCIKDGTLHNVEDYSERQEKEDEEKALADYLGEGFHWDRGNASPLQGDLSLTPNTGMISLHGEDTIESMTVENGHVIIGKKAPTSDLVVTLPYTAFSFSRYQREALRNWIDIAGIKDEAKRVTPKDGLIFEVKTDPILPRGKYVFALTRPDGAEGLAVPYENNDFNAVGNFPVDVKKLQWGLATQRYETKGEFLPKKELKNTFDKQLNSWYNLYYEIRNLPVFTYDKRGNFGPDRVSVINTDNVGLILPQMTEEQRFYADQALNKKGYFFINADLFENNHPVKKEDPQWRIGEGIDVRQAYIDALGGSDAEKMYNWQKSTVDPITATDGINAALQRGDYKQVGLLGDSLDERRIKFALEKEIIRNLPDNFRWNDLESKTWWPTFLGYDHNVTPSVMEVKDAHLTIQARDKSAADGREIEKPFDVRAMGLENIHKLDKYLEVTGYYKDSPAIVPTIGTTFSLANDNHSYVVTNVQDTTVEVSPDDNANVHVQIPSMEATVVAYDKDHNKTEGSLNSMDLRKFQESIIDGTLSIGDKMSEEETNRISSGKDNSVSLEEKEIVDTLGEGFHWDWHHSHERQRTDLWLNQDGTIIEDPDDPEAEQRIQSVDVKDGRLHLVDGLHHREVPFDSLMKEQTEALKRWIDFVGIREGHAPLVPDEGLVFKVNHDTTYLPKGKYVFALNDMSRTKAIAIPLGEPLDRPHFPLNFDSFQRGLVKQDFTTERQYISKEGLDMAIKDYIGNMAKKFHEIDNLPVFEVEKPNSKEITTVSPLNEDQTRFIVSQSPNNVYDRRKVNYTLESFGLTALEAKNWEVENPVKADDDPLNMNWPYIKDSAFDVRNFLVKAVGDNEAEYVYNHQRIQPQLHLNNVFYDPMLSQLSHPAIAKPNIPVSTLGETDEDRQIKSELEKKILSRLDEGYVWDYQQYPLQTGPISPYIGDKKEIHNLQIRDKHLLVSIAQSLAPDNRVYASYLPKEDLKRLDRYFEVTGQYKDSKAVMPSTGITFQYKGKNYIIGDVTPPDLEGTLVSSCYEIDDKLQRVNKDRVLPDLQLNLQEFQDAIINGALTKGKNMTKKETERIIMGLNEMSQTEQDVLDYLGEGYHWDWKDSKLHGFQINIDNTNDITQSDRTALALSNNKSVEEITRVDVFDGRVNVATEDAYKSGILLSDLSQEHQDAFMRWVKFSGIKNGQDEIKVGVGQAFQVSTGQNIPWGPYVIAQTNKDESMGLAVPISTDDDRLRPAFLINKDVLKQRLVDLTYTSPQSFSKEYAIKAEDSHIKNLSNTFYDIDCNDAYKTKDGNRVSLLQEWQADFLKTLAPDHTDGRIDSQMRTYKFVAVDADSWAKAKTEDVPDKFKFYGDSDFDLRPAFERALGEEGAKTLYNQINYQKHIVSDDSILEEMRDKKFNGELEKSGLLGEIQETPKLTVGESFSLKDQKGKWRDYTVAVTEGDGSRGIAVPFGFDETYRPAMELTAESLQGKYDNQQAVRNGEVSRSTTLFRARNHIIDTFSFLRNLDEWPVLKTDNGQRFSAFRGSQVNFLEKLSSKEDRETMEKMLDVHGFVAVDPDKWTRNLNEPTPDRYELPAMPGIDLRPAFERILGTEDAARLYNHLTRPLPIITDENTYKAIASMEKAHQFNKHREEGFLGTTEGKRIEDIIVSKLGARHGKEYHWNSLDEGHFGFTVKTKDNPAFDVFRLDSADHRVNISNRQGDRVALRDLDPSEIKKIDRMLSVTGEYYHHDKIEPEIGTVFAVNDPKTNARTSYVITGTIDYSGDTGYAAKAFDDALNPIKGKLYAFEDKYDFQKAVVDGKITPYRFMEKEDVDRIKEGRISEQSMTDKKALGNKYAALYDKAQKFLETKERPADVKKIDYLAHELINAFEQYVKASPATNPNLVKSDRKVLMNMVNNITTLDYVLDKPQEDKDHLDKIFNRNDGLFFDLTEDGRQHAKTFYMSNDGQRQRVQDWQMAYLNMAHPDSLRIVDMDMNRYDYYYQGGRELLNILPEREFTDSRTGRPMTPQDLREKGKAVWNTSDIKDLNDIHSAIASFGMMDEYRDRYENPDNSQKIGQNHSSIDGEFYKLSLYGKADYAMAKKYEDKTIKNLGMYSSDVRMDHIVVRPHDQINEGGGNYVGLNTTVNTEFRPYEVYRHLQDHPKDITEAMPNNLRKLNTLMARADRYLAQMDPKNPDVLHKEYNTDMLSGGSVQTHLNKLGMMMEVVSAEFAYKRATNTLTDKDRERYAGLLLDTKKSKYASNLAGMVSPDKLDSTTRSRFNRYLTEGAKDFLNLTEHDNLMGNKEKDNRRFLLLGSPELHARRMQEYYDFRNAAKELDSLPKEQKDEYSLIIDRLHEEAKKMQNTGIQASPVANEVLTPKENDSQQKGEGQSSYYDFVRKTIERVKAKNANTIVLFNSGDVFIAYGKDAEKLKDLLGLPLIKADKPEDMDKVAFPHRALDTYLTRMIRKGNRVAVYDPKEDIRQRPGEKPDGLSTAHDVGPKVPQNSNSPGIQIPDISRLNTDRIDMKKNGQPFVFIMKRMDKRHTLPDMPDERIPRFFVGAQIDGKRHYREIPKMAYMNTFRAEDKERYKFALAAAAFSDILGLKGADEKIEASQQEPEKEGPSVSNSPKSEEKEETRRGTSFKLGF
ncbi:MAG: hypothetical protein PUF37_07825 [Prevotellaceae bacterium]|nr:hypothetical protein [Prevotellaceae bacterium]